MASFYRISFRLIFLFTLAPFCLLAQGNSGSIPATQPEQKLTAPLRQDIKHTAPSAYRIQVKDKAAFRQWLRQSGLQARLQELPNQTHIVLLTGIAPDQLPLLLSCPHIRYIDKPNRAAKEELTLKDTDFSANTIYAVQSKFPQLDGSGMAVSIKENAFDPTDLDLLGRVLQPDRLTSTTTHATTMATIVAGAGNTGPAGKGVTQRAQVASSDFAELMPDDSGQLLQAGISVQNHSYGVGVENYYGLEATAYDEQAHAHPTLLHVFSSGNSGTAADGEGIYAGIAGMANLTGQFKTSKNTLSVGALEPTGLVGNRSSRGPTYDGRIKPEVVAHGTGGTSEAAAVVAGVALLVQQAYKERYTALPPASLVKAALVNSADDVGRPEVDFESGFGTADALGAVRSITENRFFSGEAVQGQAQVYTITVPAGARMLKATIVWHEAASTPDANAALLNDLDLTLRHTATNQVWLPWVLNPYPHPDSLKLPAKRGTDRINNIEQITLAAPVAGTYELKVTGYRVPEGPQPYSLVYEFEQENLEWLFPTASATLTAGKKTRLRWQGATAGTARLEFRATGNPNWEVLEETVNLSDNYYDWTPPAAVALAQVRLVADHTIATSEEFILSTSITLQAAFNCENKAVLHWAPLPDVTQYQLYHLQGTHLEPFQIITDTLVVIDKTVPGAAHTYIAVAPVVAGRAGQRSSTLDYENASSGCYIKSFLSNKFVTDSVQLHLEISTLYQLASLHLERLENGIFKEISLVSPVTQHTHLLHDPNPIPGKNMYRVKATTATGEVVYSQQEEVVYAYKGFVQVYPNPVTAGQPLYIAHSSDLVHLQLYDHLGRLLYESTESGIIKEIPTSRLARGLYVLKVRSDNGTSTSAKVLIL